MGDFDAEFVEAVKVQSWSLYSVGMLFVCVRMFARIKRLGIRHLQPDDYLMVLVGGLYTALIVTLNVICQGGGSNLYPPELTGTFTEEEIHERIFGSKIVVVSEQAMLNLIYCIKTCMLIMYTRLTLGLTTQKMVRYLACYVGVGWTATQIAFFTACRPFEGYWAMPPPNPQCTTLEHYAIVQGCFNITSDLLMLCIPIPLVLKVSMPWRQKVVLLFIFSMGGFVIVAALLTKVFNLTDVWNPTYMLWYIRESSVAVFVSNIPMIWPLLREWFPFLRGLTPSRPSYQVEGGGGAGSGYPRKGSSATPGGSHSASAGGSGLRSGGGSSTPSRGVMIGLRGVRGGSGRRESLDSTYDMELGLKTDQQSPGVSAGAGSSSNNDGEDNGSPPSSSHMAAEASSSTEQIITLPIQGATTPPRPAGTTTTEVTVLDRRAPLNGIHIERTVEIRAEREVDLEKGAVFDWSHNGRATHLTNVQGFPR